MGYGAFGDGWEIKRGECTYPHRLEDLASPPEIIYGRGDPSALAISSALPWSAVIMAMPPIFLVASTTRPTQVSTVSTALMAASYTPV